MISPIFQCGRFRLDLSRPRVMGILNVTPDSFSDGGRYFARDAALRRAEEIIAEGADLLDIGGESTRPGAEPVALAAEIDRVLPLVERLRDCGIPLSVDTYKPELMRAVLAAGADMINDVRGFRDPAALDAVASASGACGLCAMHARGEPRTMQDAPVYRDPIDEIRAFLRERVAALRAAGIAAERISVDPGFGFGKTAAHNYALLAGLAELAVDGAPVLVGLSRKSMLGAATGRDADERLAAGLAAAICAVERGARLVRTHDVAATVDALNIWCEVRAAAPRSR